VSKRKLLLHISDVSNWEVVFGNIGNLIKAIGKESIASIRVLANVNAVLAAKDPEVIKKINELYSMGDCLSPEIRFFFCRNSLEKFEIKEATLPASIIVVIAGIEFLTRWENRHEVEYVKI